MIDECYGSLAAPDEQQLPSSGFQDCCLLLLVCYRPLAFGLVLGLRCSCSSRSVTGFILSMIHTRRG